MARTSAAVALVLALVASSASSLMCLAECETPAPTAKEQAGSCHREAESDPDDNAALTAAPHDCESHASQPASLSMAKPGTGASLRAGGHIPPPSPNTSFVSVQAPISLVTAHDLAPPDRAAAVTAPLRI